MMAAAMTALQLIAIVHPALADTLEWSRDEIAQGQWWRLLTGHWVQLGMTHLGLNLAGLALLVVLFDRSLPAKWYAGYLLAAPLAISLCLFWSVPELDWYRGFSGCLHGLFVMLALADLPARRRWNGLLLAGLLTKLLAEPFWPAGTAGLIGAPVIYHAHWFGALTGLVTGLVYLYVNDFRKACPS